MKTWQILLVILMCVAMIAIVIVAISPPAVISLLYWFSLSYGNIGEILAIILVCAIFFSVKHTKLFNTSASKSAPTPVITKILVKLIDGQMYCDIKICFEDIGETAFFNVSDSKRISKNIISSIKCKDKLFFIQTDKNEQAITKKDLIQQIKEYSFAVK